MKNKKQQETLFTLVCLALLIAMQVVLARFGTINLGITRFSLSFIPVVIAARSFGVLSSVAVYGLGDLVGAIAFPTTGAFNPCFTITAALSGLIFGLFLSKKADIMRIIGSVLCSQVFCTLMLNSFWLWKFYYSAEKGYTAVLLSRLPQSIITAVLQILFMAFFLEKIARIIKRLLKR
ncbi:MAG: folate family ECF transporter S component [Clostridia bacterium]|nr:folate family ECF transporter S component [Clostridia bacterium]